MSQPIMFYDGECGLCSRTVQWCLRNDKLGIVRFAPIQGSTYAALDNPNKPIDISTMVLAEGAQLFIKSTGVLRLMTNMGGIWKPLGQIGLICPGILRDKVYDFVAKRRLKFFGSADSCAMPSPDQRVRFLQ
jgi:predicted DCC family thiol-disulfide oxidoreductase YuxK